MLKIFYGEDDFRLKSALQEAKKDFLRKTQENGQWLEVDFLDLKASEELNKALVDQGLFSASKIVVVKNFFESKKKKNQKSDMGEEAENIKSNDDDLLEKILSFAESQTQEIVLVEPKKLPLSSKWAKKINLKAKTFAFEFLIGFNLEKWAIGYLKNIDQRSEILPPALKELIILVGPDTWQISRELEKLSQLADGGKITIDLVREITSAKTENSVFEILDALASGDQKTALLILEKELKRGENPLYFLSMVIYQFRNLLKIADLARRKQTVNVMIKETKLHPFVVEKSLKQIRRFSWEKLNRVYQRLAVLDIEAKTGKTDPKRALEKLFVEI